MRKDRMKWARGDGWYFLYFLLFCGADAFVYPYLNLYFAWRGLLSTQVGLINSLSYICTVLAGFVYGYMADRSGRPRTLLLLGIVGAALSVCWISASRGALALCLASVLYTFNYVPSGDLGDKLTLDRLGDDTRRFSLFRLGGPVGYGIGVLAAGWIVAKAGIASVFCGGVLALVCALVAVLRMKAPRKSERGSGRAPFRQVIAHDQSWYFYGVMALWGFVESGSLPYLSVYVDGLGFSAKYTAALISMAMAGQMLGYLCMPAVLRRVRARRMVRAGFFCMALRVGALVGMRLIPAPVMAATQFFGGLSQPFLLATMTQMIGENYRGEASSTAQTLKTVANRGVGGSIGVFAFGWLCGVFPSTFVMALFAAVSLLAGVLTLAWSRKARG